MTFTKRLKKIFNPRPKQRQYHAPINAMEYWDLIDKKKNSKTQIL